VAQLLDDPKPDMVRDDWFDTGTAMSPPTSRKP
jgi:hypothetical protein